MDKEKLKTQFKKLKPREQDIAAILIAGMVGLTLTVHPDNALTWASLLGDVPYGVAWSWLNPGWTGIRAFQYLNPTFYSWYILAFQMGATAVMFWLVKKGKMNRRMVYLYMATTIFYRNMTVFQEITPTIFLPFASINPLFTLGFLIQKYPFWTLVPSLTDPHYLCAVGQCITYTIPRFSSGYAFLDGDFSIHLTMLYWLVTPLYAWWMKRRMRLGKGNWDEKKFWSRMTYILLAVMVFGLFWLTVVGCCYGWNPPPVPGPGGL